MRYFHVPCTVQVRIGWVVWVTRAINLAIARHLELSSTALHENKKFSLLCSTSVLQLAKKPGTKNVVITSILLFVVK